LRYWFTDYEGNDWDPSYGYSEEFVLEVRALRDRFSLKKESTGVESGGTWVPYTTPAGHIIQIAIPKLRWREKGRWIYLGKDIEIPSPLLRVELRVGEAKKPSLLSRSRVKVFWEDEIQITFPEAYPTINPNVIHSGKPQIRVSSSYGATERNILAHGILCVMNNPGDWNPETDRVIRAIEVAADWASRHFR
jgi:hypothetical protein